MLLGVKNATDEEINNALKQAAFLDDVNQLEDGLETSVGERGSALSGGQRQRLAITFVVN